LSSPAAALPHQSSSRAAPRRGVVAGAGRRPCTTAGSLVQPLSVAHERVRTSAHRPSRCDRLPHHSQRLRRGICFIGERARVDSRSRAASPSPVSIHRPLPSTAPQAALGPIHRRARTLCRGRCPCRGLGRVAAEQTACRHQACQNEHRRALLASSSKRGPRRGQTRLRIHVTKWKVVGGAAASTSGTGPLRLAPTPAPRSQAGASTTSSACAFFANARCSRSSRARYRSPPRRPTVSTCRPSPELHSNLCAAAGRAAGLAAAGVAASSPRCWSAGA